ncbi:hypothetical protein [Sinorhizobium terangae]|uniref:hypothetical protein n=1 Tax=Sinorhizobium terangae TaxID=110322 RepID=UPI0024B1D527|nr:hypothetical protein [Sinorhizobium terangae]WFU49138.1 hypothetical protein QA637_06995 [Sinorhizobium terangae]
MKCEQHTARAIAAAIKAGKARGLNEKVSVEEIAQLGLRSNDCHSNAEKFAKVRGGQVVRGWLAGPNYYIPHSIVDLNGALHEVTPVDGGLYNTCEFVAESDVPDAVWSRVPAVVWSC